MQSCDTPFGTLQLQRYPLSSNPTLQAFDAADLYLLNSLAEQGIANTPPLVINDHFGTLACALARHAPHSWGDSDLAHRALQDNLGTNQLAADSVHFFNSQQVPPGPYQQVLLRIPKSLALLEAQLIALRPLLAEDATVIAGAMLKHLPHSAGDLLARHIGPYQASLAWKKARLLTSRFTPELPPANSTLPTQYPLRDTALTLTNLPGVFSRSKLDIGTRVMLPCIPADQACANIIDLGCGNGALGLLAAQRNPQAHVSFIDESYAAVASARLNFNQGFPGRTADFLVNDGLLGIPAASADLILCNPPFHQLQAIGDDIAMRLFEQSAKRLAADGTLMVVGNRHLGYHVKLRRFFGHVQQVGGDAKFVVLAASQPSIPSPR